MLNFGFVSIQCISFVMQLGFIIIHTANHLLKSMQ